ASVMHAADGLIAVLPEMARMSAGLTHLLGPQTVPRGRHRETHNQVARHNVLHQLLIVLDAAMRPKRTVFQSVNPGVYGKAHAFYPMHMHRNFFAHAMRIVGHYLKPSRIVLRRFRVGSRGGIASRTHEFDKVYVVLHQRPHRLLQFVYSVAFDT